MSTQQHSPQQHSPMGNRYTIESSTITQGDDYELYLDLVVKPPVEIGDKLGDYLYGEIGEVALHTLSKNPEFTHIELRTSPRRDRLVAEIGIFLDRFEEYLEIGSDDPQRLKQMRGRNSVRKEAKLPKRVQ